MSILGLLAIGFTTAHGSLTSQPAMNGKLKVATLAPDEIRYTGKPYNKELGAYVFNERNYDPTISRWTTADPSGFPDGANNQAYAPVPTSDFDYQGLLKWSTLTDTHTTQTAGHPGGASVTFEVYTVKTDDGATDITLWKYVSGAPAGEDYTYNCAGYVFGKSQYWIQSDQVPAILKGDGHKQIAGPNYTGAKIADWGTDHVASVTTVDGGGTVTKVTGKLGSTVGLTTSAPADQFSGTVTYWE